MSAWKNYLKATEIFTEALAFARGEQVNTEVVRTSRRLGVLVIRADVHLI